MIAYPYHDSGHDSANDLRSAIERDVEAQAQVAK